MGVPRWRSAAEPIVEGSFDLGRHISTFPGISHCSLNVNTANHAYIALEELSRKSLFTQVRGIGILGSSYPRSCIASPRYP